MKPFIREDFFFPKKGFVNYNVNRVSVLVQTWVNFVFSREFVTSRIEGLNKGLLIAYYERSEEGQ